MPGNDLTSNPWNLDTASATDLHPIGPVFVEQIEFYDYAVDTDTCTLTDRNGVVVWKGNGASDLQTVRSGKIGWVLGLKLTVKTAGNVFVYIK
jgi:hypothetical protein